MSAPTTGLTWQRVHPITPLINGWKALAVIAVIVVQQAAESIREAAEALERFGSSGVLVLLAVILGIVLLFTAYSAVAWRMTRYAVSQDTVYLQSGVVFRQQRSAPLDRVQAIDVVQPLLARLTGLAELRFEVAGGADSRVRLAFLREDRARALRNELLARAAGVEFGTAEVPVAPEAPEREMYQLDFGRQAASMVRSAAVLVSALLILGVVVAAIAAGTFEVVFGAFPVVFGAAAMLWQRLAVEFGFRVALSPDGIRLRHGLLEQRSQTVPPGRVQAVRFTQGPLWRGKDWWRLDVNVAGYGASSEGNVSHSVLIPVGTREEALTALWLILPDLGVADAREVLDEGLSGSGSQAGFVTSPRSARWLDPLTWRRTGYALTERAVLARRGRIVRRLTVVPHERSQSLGADQGPIERRLGLANVSLHSTPGPITPVVHHLSTAAAAALLTGQVERARVARAAEGPEHWMQRVQVPQPQQPQEAPDLPSATVVPGPPPPPSQTPPPPPPPPPGSGA